MVFYNEVFPVTVAQNARGGPERRTEIVTLNSGHEERNAVWYNSKRRFNAGLGISSVEEMEKVLTFFEACNGRLMAFRFLDPFDHKSCSVLEDPSAEDQIIGMGDGSTSAFQLIKTYTQGERQYTRHITKPITQSVVIAIDSVPLENGVDYLVDELTGIISFSSPPASGAQVTAGFEFHLPARFDTDYLSLTFAQIRAGAIPDIPVVEVLGE